MKKEYKILMGIVAVILVICVGFYGYQAMQPKDLVVVQHGNEVILTFDLHKDAIYQVEGDVGTVNIEVRDGRYHVFDVDCPNHDCEKMGWADKESILPITCLPNAVVMYIK